MENGSLILEALQHGALHRTSGQQLVLDEPVRDVIGCGKHHLLALCVCGSRQIGREGEREECEGMTRGKYVWMSNNQTQCNKYHHSSPQYTSCHVCTHVWRLPGSTSGPEGVIGVAAFSLSYSRWFACRYKRVSDVHLRTMRHSSCHVARVIRLLHMTGQLGGRGRGRKNVKMVSTYVHRHSKNDSKGRSSNKRQ